MNRLSHLPAVALCLLALAIQVYGQTPSGKTPAQNSGKQGKNAPAPKRERPDPLAGERRATALMLATSLAEEARSFRDESLRARVLARTADALWESETERARALFRRAWEAAETADRESLKRLEEQRRANPSGASFRENSLELRAEVLRLASRRDRSLGEEFLAEAAEDAPAEPLTITPGKGQSPIEVVSSDPEKPTEAIAGRLGLASQFLEEGDIERALQFADKALDRVTTQGIYFLSLLREKNQAAADQRFAALLARAANDPASDAVTVSVLSSYAFTPFLYIIVRRDGQNHSSQQREQIVAPQMSAQLRAAFFDAAAQILLRPLPTPDQDRTLAGRPGLYFTIARLLPLFDQYAPDYSPELRAQLGALTPDAPEQFRTGQSNLLTRGLAPEETMKDEGQVALESLDRATTAEERDNLHVRAAMVAARKGDARAREYVDKIDDSDLRKRARAHVDFMLL
ncbi:MAG TPA: hypothetical protein VEQ40_01575, partial [Pyrinomonadaceae bacterium]|nr:hypothetical protein [Pyrinomonadaceae bacterium]